MRGSMAPESESARNLPAHGQMSHFDYHTLLARAPSRAHVLSDCTKLSAFFVQHRPTSCFSVSHLLRLRVRRMLRESLIDVCILVPLLRPMRPIPLEEGNRDDVSAQH
jgi:hypothetical protein